MCHEREIRPEELAERREWGRRVRELRARIREECGETMDSAMIVREMRDERAGREEWTRRADAFSAELEARGVAGGDSAVFLRKARREREEQLGRR